MGRLKSSGILSFLVLCLILFSNIVAQTVAHAGSPRLSYKKCWETEVEVLPQSGLTADNENGYFIDRAGKLVSLELFSGRTAWTAEIGGEVRSEVTVANNRVMVVASPVRGGSLGSPVLGAYSVKTGLPIWNVDLPRADKYYLQVAGGGLAVVSSSGNVWFFDTAAGRLEWHSKARGGISSEPRINRDRILLAIDGKNVQEFSLEDGADINFVKVDGNPAFVGAGRSSAAVYSDGRGNVHSINMSGGKNWKFRTGGRVAFVRPVNGSVLIGSTDNFVYFMSVEYGSLLWKRRLPGRIANGGLIGTGLAIFTVIGERSAFVIELEKGRIVDRLDLGTEDIFFLTPLRANSRYLLAATASGISAFSTTCPSK